jgi:hypothetical protein
MMFFRRDKGEKGPAPPPVRLFRRRCDHRLVVYPHNAKTATRPEHTPPTTAERTAIEGVPKAAELPLLFDDDEVPLPAAWPTFTGAPDDVDRGIESACVLIDGAGFDMFLVPLAH